MKILIIGGSHFLGRAISETANAHGHQVTIFNRGKTQPFLIPAGEEIHGDRYVDLDPLRGHSWDVVIDTCGYHPWAVGTSAFFLDGIVDRYVFISSISVYRDLSISHIDEHAGILDWPKSALLEDSSSATYGARKVLCELAVEEVFQDNVFIIRPGVLAGPYDSMGRVPYWLQRVARGGDILAPGDPLQPIQLIDARDVASWILKMIEGTKGGIYNAVGPLRRLTFQQFLETCQRVVGSDCRFIWVDEAFLLSNKIAPWTELPLWVPEFIGGLQEISANKAVSQGLICRPLDSTLLDTYEWMCKAEPSWPEQSWLTPQRETQLLGEWSATVNKLPAG